MMSSKRKFLIALGVSVLAVILFAAWIVHGTVSDLGIEATSGRDPKLVEADVEHIPTVSLARTIGWKANEAPVAGKGLSVGRFADGLDHPRTLLVLPNGDVLVAEASAPEGSNSGGIRGLFERLLMNMAGAAETSPDRIVLLRDADGDGKAEQRFTLRQKDLVSPSGMAWVKGKLYVASHDAVLAFDFEPGATSLAGEPRKLMDLPAAGNHWMRNLLPSADGSKLYIAVGSASNVGERGMELEQGRAAIWELDLASGSRRQFAGGMRNPNGMAWNPSTGELWTVVNERDMLGPDLVPDYLTNVPIGAQYGWPWVYWKDVLDWRVDYPIPDFMTGYTRKPEYALGAHTSALGLVFVTGGQVMGLDFANGAFIARHGSWNRKPLAGYDVVYVRFDERGNPVGMPVPVLTGFLTGDGNKTHGRPTWLAWDKAGALLVSDDTGGVVWRVQAPGARPAASPRAVVSQPMPAQPGLKGGVEATLGEIDNILKQ